MAGRAPSISVERYVVESLMCDLAGHDRHPAAFLVYLTLYARARGRNAVVTTSLAQLAADTGLSKSGVQSAVRLLRRRGLLEQHRASITAVPRYRVLRPWRR